MIQSKKTRTSSRMVEMGDGTDSRKSSACATISAEHCFANIFRILVVTCVLLTFAMGTVNNYTDDGICRSVDIRSTTQNFDKLNGCRVVEGNVHILLLDKTTSEDFENISFPHLTEITGFFLLYRVEGLRTLANLFPNLTVIRGQELLYNHAFIMYELSSIQEIGLYSLTDIERGAVYIAKNPNLCFVQSIDWGLIVKQGVANNVIDLNKGDNECGICRGDEKRGNGGNENDRDDSKICPVATKHAYSSSIGPHLGRHLCWNREHCQKVCPCDDNRTCNDRAQCCTNDQCLGGCYGDNLDKCKACKNLSIWRDGEHLCTSECPDSHKYMLLNRRCVNAEQCRNMPRPKGDDKHSDKPYKIFENSCLLDCPVDYEESEDIRGQLICKKCEGQCIKSCDAAIVNSIHTAQHMKDCTIINGSLEIQLRDGNNIVHELYDNLGQITEIVGYLKITRSYPLISLGFLKNLRVIRGKSLDTQKFSLVVKDNSNLQELWDYNNDTKHELKIENGRVQFHYNPKLCMEKIEHLVNLIGIKNITEDEIQSNGDKVACNLADLDLRVTAQIISAQLDWPEFKMEDDRYLLGYVVYWMKTDRTNISIYESRDACGGDGWNVDDVPKLTPSDNFIYYPLTKLEPFTHYAVYVRTYTIASSPTGAQSQIKYFRTLPGVPTGVVNLSVNSNDSSVLVVSWKPPLKPNGKIDQYIIVVEEGEATSPDQRNYCEDGPEATPKTPLSDIFHDDFNEDDEIETDDDEFTPQIELKYKETEAEAAASFEDALQNWVYVKRSPDKQIIRNKREIRNSSMADNSILGSGRSSANNRSNINGTLVFHTNQTDLVVRNLKHYREYTVRVKACRQYDPSQENESTACSSIEVIGTKRTLARPGADDVKGITLEPKSTNQSIGMVRVSWSEPPEPNGVIQTYQIEYKRLNIENIKPTIVCITRNQYREANGGYEIKDLPAGNYSLKLRATSLGGEGAYSEYQYFYIPPASSATNVQVAVGVGFSVLCLLCISLSAIVFFRRNYTSVPNMKLIASVNPEYVSTAYVPDDWEVPRKDIELIKELGQGSFGMVYEGIAHGIVPGIAKMRCAIKTVNEHATDRERIEFLNEASVMKAFDTSHVVRLLGVVSQGQPTLVIMELMSNGDLKSYLRSHRPEEQGTGREHPPSLKRVLQMAIEIADGMAYLTAKKFVHRDLAARNCMVSDTLTVKIGDFGMTRDIYETDYYRKGSKGLLPVRWMAPESLKDGVFQSSSDVWSYGVVLWEMATLASQPYQGLSNEQVLRYVIDGGVMERPENCPDKLYELMRLCWQHKSSARPTFLELAGMLLPEASAEFRQVAFYFTKAGQEAIQAQQMQVQDDAEATTPLRPRNTDDGDGFSLDSGSDHEDFNGDSVSGGRVSFPSSSFLTATYHDKPEGGSSTAANGFVSISDAATVAAITASSQSASSRNAPPPTSVTDTGTSTTQC